MYLRYYTEDTFYSSLSITIFSLHTIHEGGSFVQRLARIAGSLPQLTQVNQYIFLILYVSLQSEFARTLIIFHGVQLEKNNYIFDTDKK